VGRGREGRNGDREGPRRGIKRELLRRAWKGNCAAREQDGRWARLKGYPHRAGARRGRRAANGPTLLCERAAQAARKECILPGERAA
jgi:hypothetical protein